MNPTPNTPFLNLLNDTASERFSKEGIIALLLSQGEEEKMLFDKAMEIKERYVGNVVHFRGLVEYSNRCGKSCYYCGIRSGNRAIHRYTVSDEEVIAVAKQVMEYRYGSMAIQSGERGCRGFAKQITNLVKEIKRISGDKIGITLSCGEQSEEVYRAWFEAGAHRYLLRIETSNPELYAKLHPQNEKHNYQNRIASLERLRKVGYQVGSGIMVGLPWQTVEDLADDILFLKAQEIDMIGMGPYIEHTQTPFYRYRDELWPLQERLNVTLKMIATLRIMMKNVNMVASTAMQAIDPKGREKAIVIGANIMMPNLTPQKYRDDYLLYQNKPGVDDDSQKSHNALVKSALNIKHTIGYDQWGDSAHFSERISGKK